MMAYKNCLIKFLLLIICKSCIVQARSVYDPVEYQVPKPKIEILVPSGLEVSIPDSPGIQLFAFHGNINQPLNNIDAGQLSKDILRREDGRWVFRDRNLKLKHGDRIYYWLYVMRDNLGYRLLNQIYTVTDNTNNENANNNDDKSDNLGSRDNPNDQSTSCERTLVNLTQTLLNLHHNIEDLRQTNHLLIDMVEKMETGKTLRLNGVGNTFDDPVEVVQVIVKQKLKLSNVNVVKAVGTGNGGITFDVSTLSEKIDIIKRAKENLTNSKFAITY